MHQTVLETLGLSGEFIDSALASSTVGEKIDGDKVLALLNANMKNKIMQGMFGRKRYNGHLVMLLEGIREAPRIQVPRCIHVHIECRHACDFKKGSGVLQSFCFNFVCRTRTFQLGLVSCR